MEIYSNNKPTSGYKIGEDGIDSYGVDHNKLTNREEIAYQMARVQREQEQQKQFDEQRKRAVENELLMDALDVLYGMNRTINGMGFGSMDWVGQKLGYDTQMNNYLKELMSILT